MKYSNFAPALNNKWKMTKHLVVKLVLSWMHCCTLVNVMSCVGHSNHNDTRSLLPWIVGVDENVGSVVADDSRELWYFVYLSTCLCY